MGNCQAINDDNASVVIQHPGGRVEKHYWPLSATEIMNTNPGHYVALLLTTTTLNSSAASTNKTSNIPPPVRRITRIKLLKPTDTLVLGQVYRLVTAQEVMQGLWAKRHSHMKQQQSSSGPAVVYKKHEKLIIAAAEKSTTPSDSSNRRRSVNVGRSDEVHKTPLQVKHERRHRSSSSAAARYKAWQPSLLSISEAAAGIS